MAAYIRGFLVVLSPHATTSNNEDRFLNTSMVSGKLWYISNHHSIHYFWYEVLGCCSFAGRNRSWRLINEFCGFLRQMVPPAQMTMTMRITLLSTRDSPPIEMLYNKNNMLIGVNPFLRGLSHVRGDPHSNQSKHSIAQKQLLSSSKIPR